MLKNDLNQKRSRSECECPDDECLKNNDLKKVKVNRIPIDIWRSIINLIDLSDIPSVSCIKYFKENVLEHQGFWIHHFKKEFPNDVRNIINDAGNYKEWKKIRQFYGFKKSKILDYRRVEIDKIDVIDTEPFNEESEIGKVIYKGGNKLLFQTPKITFGRMGYKSILFDLYTDDQRFIRFLKQIDNHIISKFNLSRFQSTANQYRRYGKDMAELYHISTTPRTKYFDKNRKPIVDIESTKADAYSGRVVLYYSHYFDYKTSEERNRFSLEAHSILFE